MNLPGPLYRVYERHLLRELHGKERPRHVAVILDGNRRWAKSAGWSAAQGHQRGADKIVDFLTWCEEAGIPLVTLWMLSTDNLSRSRDELTDLVSIIEGTIEGLAASGRWRVQVVGALDLLPEATRDKLLAAQRASADADGVHVNVAIGYGGRREIADAVRSLIQQHAKNGASIEELAEAIDVEHIADHLYTKGQPDPDLVIRTSGEQRLGGFLMWQSVHSEFYFCEALWPEFRRVDFLRALRDYSHRERRLGR